MNLRNKPLGRDLMQSCYLCNGSQFNLLHQGVRDNPKIDVLECKQCGLVCLSAFEHIDDSFYEESSMLGGKVDLVKYRIQSLSDDKRRFLMLEESIKNNRILDFGCGGGGFIKLASEIANKVNGVELDRSIRETLTRVDQFEVFRSIDEIVGEFDTITMFHVVEHLKDPVDILSKLKTSLSPTGQLIVEVPSANDALLKLYQSTSFADFTYWSCHLFLYTPETLGKIAERAGYQIDYIKQVQRYPLSNHLHWLAKGKPGGHRIWEMMNAPELHAAYERQLASIGMCDTLFARFRVKPN